jgi:hypothetical protein
VTEDAHLVCTIIAHEVGPHPLEPMVCTLPSGAIPEA